jgi:hypothetical protein
MSFGGSTSSMNSSLKENKRLRKNATKRYSKVKEQYIGVGNENGNLKVSNLTSTQLAEGRKRAKAYYSKRNIRLYTQIIVISVLACTLVGWLVWYLLG